MGCQLASALKIIWIGCFFITSFFSCTSNTSNESLDFEIQEKLKQVKKNQDSLEYDIAIETLQSIRDQSNFEFISDSLKSNVYHKHALMLYKKERYQEANLQLDTAIMIRSIIEDFQIKELANSYYMRAQVKIQLKHEKALSDIQKAIKLIEQTGEQKILAKYYIIIAAALQENGDFGQANQYYQKVLNDNNIKEESSYMALLHLNLSNFYALQGKYEDQRKSLQKAFKIYKKIGKRAEREYFAAANSFGASFLYQDQWGKADTYNVKLLEEIRQSEKKYFKIEEDCLNNLAYGSIKAKNLKKSRGYYTDLLDLSSRMNSSPYGISKARAYEGIGDVDMEELKHSSAITNYHKAIQSLFLDFNSADIYALPSVNENPLINKIEALRILDLKSKAHIAQFDEKQQQKDLEAAIEIYHFQDALLTKTRQGFKAASSRYDIVKESIPVYERATSVALQLYEISDDKKYVDHALHFASKNKAVILQDGLQNERALFAGIPKKLLKQENELKKENYQLETEILDLESSGKKTKALSDKKDQRFEVVRSYEKLIQQLEEDYPDYYKLKYEASQMVAPDAIAASLPNEAALIEFFVGRRNLFVFTISSKGLKHYVLPKPRKLFTKTRKLRSLLQDNSNPTVSKEYLEVANDLYKYLLEKPLEDLEKEQEIKRLIIIPDNQLLQVSFDALLYKPVDDAPEDLSWNNPDIPYLIKKYAISYAYSNKLLTDKKSNSRIKEAVTTFAGFGLEYDDFTLEGINELSNLEVDTTLSRGMGKLYHSVSEVEEVQEIIGAGDIWRKTEATKATFLKNAPKTKILHLAMHGYESADNPLSSALIFTRKKEDSDFLLKAADLYSITLSADMTVLSACHTASGRVYQGEGVRSLARAFRYSGCPSLVATLWSVSDYSTKEIMVDFYKHLKNNDPKDIALQKAKLNYLKTAQPAQKMPYFWTNLVLIGDTNPLDF